MSVSTNFQYISVSKAMIMGTHSVTHQNKNECNTVPVPMLPRGSHVEI